MRVHTALLCWHGNIFSTIWNISKGCCSTCTPLPFPIQLKSTFFSSYCPTRDHIGRSTRNSNPVMTSSAGDAKGCLDHRFRAPLAYTAQLLTEPTTSIATSTHPICLKIWIFIWAKYCPFMKQKVWENIWHKYLAS